MKNKLEAKKKKVSLNLAFVLVNIAIIASILILSNVTIQKTVILSCKEGRFEGYGNMVQPIKFSPDPEACSGTVEVRDSDGSLICSITVKGKSLKEIVKVPCPGLNTREKSDLVIKFATYSTLYGNHTDEVKVYPREAE